ncbi:putative cyclin-L1-like protein [Cladobotryum mycophilum]|uniref:Cyclin-L1-like protein n=1 Tax=Cladobotryum mycophilum TaxID=491253 RepID=A0ABR0T2N7_9HYPO
MAHLTNPLATPSQLYNKTNFSSLPQDLQETIFIATQCLTQAAGRLLELPQSVTAQANVVLARYWLIDSPMAYEFSDVSAASIYLMSKMGPAPRSPRDVSNVYAYLLSRDSVLFRTGDAPKNNPNSYYQTEADYYAFQQRILGLEARILSSLSFDTRVALPHPLAITYLQTLDFLSQPRSDISLRTIQYLNTALLSPQMLYLTHQPHALATAAIYNAARDLGAKMPECEWWEVFDVDREELGFLVVAMRSLEGWMRQRQEELPKFGQGMLKRATIKEELRKRGVQVGNDGGAKDAEDEEQEIMRMMDGR